MGIVKQKLDTNSQKGLRKILQEANGTSSCLERGKTRVFVTTAFNGDSDWLILILILIIFPNFVSF